MAGKPLLALLALIWWGYPLQSVPLSQVDSPACPTACVALDSALARPADRQALLRAVDESLIYLQTPGAQLAYQHYPVPGITWLRVRQSLERFRSLLETSPSPAALQQAVKSQFQFYSALGQDHQGTVAFTGYFEPIYSASLRPTPIYRYPLYRIPPHFSQWPHPNPTRVQLEGEDGLGGDRGPLRGLELVWLKSRLQAFLIQVQGSAQLQLTNGQTITVGFAGRTDQPYTSPGHELVQAGIIPAAELTLPRVLAYFKQHPDQVNHYLSGDRNFVFMQVVPNQPPNGSLGVPLTAGRSIATDKTLMPPGALALIQAPLPPDPLVNRFVLDQDSGKAIRGPGRVDIFLGRGPQAEAQAGLINGPGHLYYLLLR